MEYSKITLTIPYGVGARATFEKITNSTTKGRKVVGLFTDLPNGRYTDRLGKLKLDKTASNLALLTLRSKTTVLLENLPLASIDNNRNKQGFGFFPILPVNAEDLELSEVIFDSQSDMRGEALTFDVFFVYNT